MLWAQFWAHDFSCGGKDRTRLREGMQEAGWPIATRGSRRRRTTRLVIAFADRGGTQLAESESDECSVTHSLGFLCTRNIWHG